MRKPTANKIRLVLEREIGNYTQAGYRRAKKAYNTLSHIQKSKVG